MTANIMPPAEARLRSDLSEDQGTSSSARPSCRTSKGAHRRGRQPVEEPGRQKDLYIEVEGAHDNVGGKELNYQLGMERAEAVKKYLYTSTRSAAQDQRVQLRRRQAVAPNNSRDGRAQNRPRRHPSAFVIRRFPRFVVPNEPRSALAKASQFTDAFATSFPFP
jgi:hypothetical protein